MCLRAHGFKRPYRRRTVLRDDLYDWCRRIGKDAMASASLDAQERRNAAMYFNISGRPVPLTTG